MKSPTSDAYGAIAKTFHWAMVLLVVVAWASGTFGDGLSQGAGQDNCLRAHVWIGLTVLALAAVRITWRIANPPPKVVPTEFGRWLIEWTDPASRTMHYVLYVLLVVVPAFGIALLFARGHPLPLFGLAEIRSPWPADKASARNLETAHEILANLLVILALFHMLAALLHHWVFGDNTLKRMLPHSRNPNAD
ncbi:cytochrome b [Bradyrhizobium erythrophlei]|uniref:cytochrome b n=1 Tax=Bradyrhizobium erythrophlei TaxID=1437360 RepID=UPI0035E5AFEC